MAESVEIAVIGAGVIGLAIAHRLAMAGREVLVIDPEEPGSGASWGNAGTIADYAVQPVGTPDVLRRLPALLFDRDSPLSLRRAALPALAPWLLRFARQSLPGAARRNAMVLAGLLADASARWTDLAAAIGGAGFVQDRGCLYWYRTDRGFRDASGDLAFRRSLGVGVELIDAAALHSLEPSLPVSGGGAAFFPAARFLTDPGAIVALLADAGRAAGATFRRSRVDRLDRMAGRVALAGPSLSVAAHRVVIAAGARSRALALMAGDRVPLDTERGYHLEWDMDAPRLNRPTCPTDLGFYLCPMAGRLRVAGTVELGGLTAPPSPHRIALLERGVQGILGGLGAPSRSWMGCRPSMPDSLPVIGHSSCGPDVIHAYGHGHIGLTLAPVTADLVARCLIGNAPDDRLAALRPGRF